MVGTFLRLVRKKMKFSDPEKRFDLGEGGIVCVRERRVGLEWVGVNL